MNYSVQVRNDLASTSTRVLPRLAVGWLMLLTLYLFQPVGLAAQYVPSCSDVLVSYSGDCDDPNDSFHPGSLASCISSASPIAPTAGPDPFASCNNGIICIQSQHTDWDFNLNAAAAYTFSGVSADFLFPVSMRTAGGPSNAGYCASIAYSVQFYQNGTLVETVKGVVGRDAIITREVQLTKAIEVQAGDNIRGLSRAMVLLDVPYLN